MRELNQHLHLFQPFPFSLRSLAALLAHCRVYDSPAEVKKSSTKMGYVYQSTGCPSFHVIPTGTFTGKNYVPTILNNVADSGGVCAETGRPFKVAGPVWIAPLHSQDFVSSCIKRVEDQEEVSRVDD